MRAMNLITVPAVVLGVMFSGAVGTASANPSDDTPSPRATQFDTTGRDWNRVDTRDWRRPCRPEHTSARFRWHDTRRGGHWDFLRRDRSVSHLWWDRTYCADGRTTRNGDRDRDRRWSDDWDRSGRPTVEPRGSSFDGDNRRDGRDDRGDRSRDGNRDRGVERRDTDRQIDRISAESIREQIRERIG